MGAWEFRLIHPYTQLPYPFGARAESRRDEQENMVEVKELTKYYGDYAAIEGVTFSVNKGEILGFLGPNAAGKTTTMRVITGFMPPTSGTATVAGLDIVKDSVEARKKLGYLPENVPLYEDMSV